MSFPIWQEVLLQKTPPEGVYTVTFPDNRSVLGTRRDRAAGKVAEVAMAANTAVSNGFDGISIFDRPIFNATWSARRRRWIDLVPRGAAGFTWSPAQPYREVVYRCTPFWYRLEMSERYAPFSVSVSERPLPGYTLAPMFRDGNTPVYRPVFEMSVDSDGIPHSRSGARPYCDILPILADRAKAFDPEAARLESVKDWFSDLLLQVVEFGTWVTGNVMSGNSTREKVVTGGAIGVTASSGKTAPNANACIWRGKENPWRNAASALCDLLVYPDTDETGESALYLWYLPDVRYFTGEWNSHYIRVGKYLHSSNGTALGMQGYAFSETGGFLYPAEVAGYTENTRSWSHWLQRDGDAHAVGVGGSSGRDVLSTAVAHSPGDWEVIAPGADGPFFGGRLVLEEDL